MKKLLNILLLLIAVSVLFSCEEATTPPENSVKMTATIDDIGEVLAVTVTESDYTSGIHWVVVGDETEYYSKGGNKIEKDDLKVGDTVEIYYSGQVMMSYPPKIVALQIRKN